MKVLIESINKLPFPKRTIQLHWISKAALGEVIMDAMESYFLRVIFVLCFINI